MDKNRLLIDLLEGDRTEFGRIAYPAQSPAQKVFTAIWEWEAEINNRGFIQYFINSSRETANGAPSALRAIGASQWAAIVERALAIVSPNKPVPAQPTARQELIDELSESKVEALKDLDSVFYEYRDNLTE